MDIENIIKERRSVFNIIHLKSYQEQLDYKENLKQSDFIILYLQHQKEYERLEFHLYGQDEPSDHPGIRYYINERYEKVGFFFDCSSSSISVFAVRLSYRTAKLF